MVPSLTLTESNEIQLKNANKEIVDNLDWGNIPDGKSFQRISAGNWTISNPTPGVKNEESFETTEQEEEIDNKTNNLNLDSKDNSNIPLKITTKIIAPKVVFAGIPFKISSIITTNRNETLAVGNFKWNFGDGVSREDKNSNEFEHTYFYPGDYVVLLDFSEKKSSMIDSSNRVVIKVVPNEVIISSIGNNNDAFVELENKSNYEMILSGWFIGADSHYFRIPDGTILMSKKKIKFSPKVTGFKGEYLNNVFLLNNQLEKVDNFTQNQNTSKKVSSNYLPVNKELTNKPLITNKLEEPKEELPVTINLNQLASSTGGSRVNLSNSYAYLGLGGIIILGILSVIFMRRKDQDLSIDYIEKEIRAQDFTIIE